MIKRYYYWKTKLKGVVVIAEVTFAVVVLVLSIESLCTINNVNTYLILNTQCMYVQYITLATSHQYH